MVLSLILSITGLLGCEQDGRTNGLTSTENDVDIAMEPAITGEITEITEGRFLVISHTDKLVNGDPSAIWFTTNKDIATLKVGQNVSVWATNIDYSYPGQAEADKIEIRE